MTDVDTLPWRGDPADIVTELAPYAGIDRLVRRLAEMTPTWHRDALCREYDQALWFPSRGESHEPARAVCGRCTVADECLAEGLDDPALDYGIRAGLGASQRRAMRRARRTHGRGDGSRRDDELDGQDHPAPDQICLSDILSNPSEGRP